MIRKRIIRIHHQIRYAHYHYKNLLPVFSLLFLCTVIVLTTELVKNPLPFFSKATSLTSGPPNTPKLDGLVLPSVQGAQTDAFTGSSTYSYPLSLPAGPVGQKPSLAINYSSGSVDDLKNGFDNWEYIYPAQASIVGLGWNLSGIDSITATKDNRYFATIDGVSYELVNEVYDDEYGGKPASERWHTNPESYYKITHFLWNADTWNNLAPWEVITKNGTKLYFGSELPSDPLRTPMPATAYEIQDSEDPAHPPDQNRSKRVGYKWMISRIIDTHGNELIYNYDQEIKPVPYASPYDRFCQGKYGPDENHQYVSFVRPKSISWNKNPSLSPDFQYLYKVEFNYEDRNDNNEPSDSDPDRARKKIANNSGCNNPQQHYSTKRLSQISIKVKNPTRDEYLLRHKYVLGYTYTNNAPWHSILGTINYQGTDVTGYEQARIPSHTFTYSQHIDGLRLDNGNAVYLESVNNGYGGKVTYSYNLGQVVVCKSFTGACVWPNWAKRVRVHEKNTFDGMTEGGINNSFKTTYLYFEEDASDPGTNNEGGIAYGDISYISAVQLTVTPTPSLRPASSTPTPSSSRTIITPTPTITIPLQTQTIVKNYEFLGHSWTKETLFEKNNSSQKVTVNKTQFHNIASVIQDGREYFFPSPLRGKAVKTEVLNPNDAERSLKWTQNDYLYLRDPRNKGSVWNPRFNTVDGRISKLYYPFIGLYDKTDSLDSTTSKVSYEYDQYGNQKKITEYGIDPGNGDERETITDYYYNDTKWIINKPQLVRHFRTPAGGGSFTEFSHTGYFYDGQDWGHPPTIGNVTATDKVGLNPEVHIITRMTYDNLGNPATTTDANGKTTYYTYDPIFKTYPVSIKNPMQHIAYTDYDYLLGVPKLTTNANGITSRFEYDSLARKIRTYKDGDNRDKPSIEYRYTVSIPLSARIRSRVEQNQDQFLDNYYFFNGLGQLIQEQSYGQNTDQIVIANTFYNSLGQVSIKPISYYRNRTIGTYYQPEVGLKVTYDYDPLGRLKKTTNLDGTFSTISYQGYKVTTANEAGIKKVQTNNAYGSLIKLEEYNSTDPQAPVYATTSYTYDIALGILTNIVDPKNNTTTNVYDNLGRLKSTQDPDFGQILNKSYDQNGNLLEQEDNNHKTITFQYDDLNRIVKKNYPDGKNIQYSYDEYNPGENQYGKGKLTRLTGENATIQRIYDKYGRLTKDIKTINFEGKTDAFITQYNYNNLDQIKSIIYPDNERVNYTFHRNQKTQGLEIAGGQRLVNDTSYNALGQITNQTYGNNTQLALTYRPDNLRLDNLSVTGPSAPSGHVFDNSYTYDPVGNITSIRNLQGAGNENFTYDGLNRLTSVSGNYSASYSYDQAGNIETKTESLNTFRMEYNSAQPAHAPKKVNSLSLEYDQNGNLTKDETHTRIEYDFENRPLSITTAAPSCFQGGLACTRLPITPPPGVIHCSQCCYGFSPVGMTGGICKYNTPTSPPTRQAADTTPSQTNEIIAPTMTTSSTIEVAFKASTTLNPSPQGHVVRLLSQNKDSPEPPPNYFGPEHCNGDNTPPTPETAQQGKWLYCGTDINNTVKLTYSSLGQKKLYAIFRNDQGEAASYWGGTANGWTKPIVAEVNYTDNISLAGQSSPETTRFAYGPDGARIVRVEKDTITFYSDLVEKNMSSPSAGLTKYYTANGKTIAFKKGTEINYLANDHLGSARAITDQSGQRKTLLAYYPYGKNRMKSGDASSRQFTGQILDNSTGFYYFNARYYNPLTGKFITPDKAYIGSGKNLTAYAAGNPISLVDPTGYDEEDPGTGNGQDNTPPSEYPPYDPYDPNGIYASSNYNTTVAIPSVNALNLEPVEFHLTDTQKKMIVMTPFIIVGALVVVAALPAEIIAAGGGATLTYLWIQGSNAWQQFQISHPKISLGVEVAYTATFGETIPVAGSARIGPGKRLLDPSGKPLWSKGQTVNVERAEELTTAMIGREIRLGFNLDKQNKNSLWFHGPDFLKDTSKTYIAIRTGQHEFTGNHIVAHQFGWNPKTGWGIQREIDIKFAEVNSALKYGTEMLNKVAEW